MNNNVRLRIYFILDLFCSLTQLALDLLNKIAMQENILVFLGMLLDSL